MIYVIAFFIACLFQAAVMVALMMPLIVLIALSGMSVTARIGSANLQGSIVRSMVTYDRLWKNNSNNR